MLRYEVFTFYFFINFQVLLMLDGRGKVNWKGVAYYNKLINYLLKRGENKQKIYQTLLSFHLLIDQTL